MGVSQHIGTCFRQRMVWNSRQKINGKFNQEFKVPKSTYLSWFNTPKAFANVYSGRTYAQVVSRPSHQSQGYSANQRHNKRGTRIVTVPQGNANRPWLFPDQKKKQTKITQPHKARNTEINFLLKKKY